MLDGFASLGLVVEVGRREGLRRVMVEATLPELGRREWLRSLVPARDVKSVRYRRGRVRQQPVRSLGVSVRCDSRMEAMRIIELDRAGGLAWIVSQPMVVRDTGSDPFSHVPDFLYMLSSGELVLENVKPLAFRDDRFARQSGACERLCGVLGWTYRVEGAYGEADVAWLSYLSMYADVVPLPRVVRCLRDRFADRALWTVGELRRACELDAVAYPTLMHLVWRGVLEVEEPSAMQPGDWVRLAAGGWLG